jgi:endoglucanase
MRAQLEACMAAQLAAGQTRTGTDAFRFGMGYGGGDSTAHALGYAVSARLPGTAFKPYDGQGDRYLDNVISWPSVEPTDDYTVLGLLLFARLS